jgi:hypothetical protein
MRLFISSLDARGYLRKRHRGYRGNFMETLSKVFIVLAFGFLLFAPVWSRAELDRIIRRDEDEARKRKDLIRRSKRDGEVL